VAAGAVTSDQTIVELHAHDPAWVRAARLESDRLATVLGENLVRVEHVGSTAVPAIWAKPTIDLMPLVRDVARVDSKAIEALGYDWRGEFGLSGRRYCTLTKMEKRLFNVHIFEDGSAHAVRMIAFRDYLRAHRHEARDYEAVKKQAAAQHATDTLAYNDAKSDWLQDCERRALAWKES
jgi:GrpB-like predicted nucleotidyltransferase (UPF0157 family)